MSPQIARLRKEHANFIKLLTLLENQLDCFHACETVDYELMLDVVHYMTHYIDPVHHAREDRAFARLAQRDATAYAVVAELERQHQVIADSGARLLQYLDAAVSGGVFPRETIELPARAYIEYLRRHVRKEETELFPRAEDHLCEEDWRLAEAEGVADDPLFSAAVGARYRALHEKIARHAGCGCVLEAA